MTWEWGKSMIVFLILSIVMVVTGFVLFFKSLGMTTPAYPGCVFGRLNKWVWWWDQKDCYSPGGLKYYIIGISLISNGFLIGTVYWFCRWLNGGN